MPAGSFIVPEAPDLEEFVSDMVRTCEPPFTAREVAAQYLDQYYLEGAALSFSAAVRQLTPSVAYYLEGGE